MLGIYHLICGRKHAVGLFNLYGGAVKVSLFPALYISPLPEFRGAVHRKKINSGICRKTPSKAKRIPLTFGAMHNTQQ